LSHTSYFLDKRSIITVSQPTGGNNTQKKKKKTKTNSAQDTAHAMQHMPKQKAKQFYKLAMKSLYAFYNRRKLGQYSDMIDKARKSAETAMNQGSKCIRDILEDAKFPKEWHDIWECKTAREVMERLTKMAEEIVLQTELNICLDYIAISVNLWFLYRSWYILADATKTDEGARKFILERHQSWQLLYDKALNWHTISDTQRLNAKLEIARELLQMQQWISAVEIQAERLRGDMNLKWCMVAVNMLLLWSMPWGAMSKLSQAWQWAGCVGGASLTAVSVFQIVQIASEHGMRKELQEVSAILHKHYDDLEKAAFPTIHRCSK